MNTKRIEIIDALRGFSIILMVGHHILFDLVEFFGAPEWIYTNPVLDVVRYVFVSIFVLISGISSQFSRSNIKRGIKVFGAALGITLVTWLFDSPILFGVLHMLGFCMIFFGLTRKFWDRLPRMAALALYVSLILGSVIAVPYIKIETPYLWVLGWISEGFVSADYFPLFPWLFVFLLGTWAGLFIKEKRLPQWFYDKKVPFFPAVGRKTFLIYILHQPILYGIILIVKYVGGV